MFQKYGYKILSLIIKGLNQSNEKSNKNKVKALTG